MYGSSRAEPRRTDLVAFEDIEDLAHGSAAGARRRRRNDVVAAIGAAERRRLGDRVGGKILGGENPAILPACLSDGRRDRALVERRRPLLRNQFEGSCKVVLHKAIPGLEMAAVGPQKDRSSPGVLGEPVGPRAENIGIGAAQHKTVARQRNRRRDQLGARQPAVFSRGMVEPHHRAGHAGGKVAVPAEVGDEVSLRVEIHPGGRGCGGGLAEIDERLPAVGKVNRHEPAAADIAAARVDDGQRIAYPNRGIDRIAAGLEDTHPDLGGQPMGGHDHAMLGLDHGSRGRIHRGRQQDRQHHRRCGGAHPPHPALSHRKRVARVAKLSAVNHRASWYSRSS